MSITDLHLVLDLDSTLIYTVDEDEYGSINELKLFSSSENYELRKQIYFLNILNIMDKDIQGKGKLTKMWGFFRPHVLKFLIFCSKFFYKIHIWSAGQKKYVHSIIKELFKNNNLKMPENILTYEDCVIKKDDICKPLKKIFESKTSFGANEKNTFALDDRYDTFSKNIKNGILIPAYQPNIKKKKEIMGDVCLLQLIKWFNTFDVSNSKDIRKLDKSKIFSINLTNDDYIEDYSGNLL